MPGCCIAAMKASLARPLQSQPSFRGRNSSVASTGAASAATCIPRVQLLQGSAARRNSSCHMRYQTDQHQGVDSHAAQPIAERLTADKIMSDMCTMLGGISKERFAGYAGQWRTWEVVPKQQHTGAHEAMADPANSPVDEGTTPAADLSSDSISSSGNYGVHLIDDSMNVRLWRQQGTVAGQAGHEGQGASSVSIQQANFYHHPGKMAEPSTRFAPYLTGNTMAGRPDGYGLRVWSFTRDSEMLQPDASGWLSGNGTPAECSMRVLTVPHVATTIINGALPSGFEAGHKPQFWVLEFITKEPDSAERRWSSMNWYDLGELVVNRSINEDLLHLHGEPDDIHINPQDIHFSTRRCPGLLPPDIDAWARQHTAEQQGVATVFSYSSNSSNSSIPQDSSNSLHLTRTSGQSCSWNNPFSTLDRQQRNAQGIDVVVQVYPDMSYCRVARSIKEAVEGGVDSLVFEAGSVMRDGTLVRWLLEYETTGRRLIKTATFETYPARAQQKG